MAAGGGELDRDAVPVTVSDADRPEPDRRQRFAGYFTTRTRHARTWAGFGLGCLAGAVGIAAFIAIASATGRVPVDTVGGVVALVVSVGERGGAGAAAGRGGEAR